MEPVDVGNDGSAASVAQHDERKMRFLCCGGWHALIWSVGRQTLARLVEVRSEPKTSCKIAPAAGRRPPHMNKAHYSETYYKSISGPSKIAAERILPHLDEAIHPASIVDVGCGA